MMHSKVKVYGIELNDVKFKINGFFIKKNKHLMVDADGTWSRFCAICAQQVRGSINKLDKHCQRHNYDQLNKVARNEGFLIYNNLPTDCKYDNFEEYLKNP